MLVQWSLNPLGDVDNIAGCLQGLVWELNYKSLGSVGVSCEEWSHVLSESLKGGTLGLLFLFLP